MEHMEHILKKMEHKMEHMEHKMHVWTLMSGQEKRCPALRRVGFVGTRAGKRYRARSRLYRSHILQAEILNWRNPYIVQETNVGKTATKMTATIDFDMQFEKLHESGMQVSNICGCLEFHPSCIPAFLRASSKCVARITIFAEIYTMQSFALL